MILRFCPIRPWSLLVVFIFGLLDLFIPLRAYGQTDGGKLYQTHCVKCHGADGKGQAARAIEPDIPDFTDSAWQNKRSDTKLLESILDGKGKTMPAFRDKKLNEDQARTLVAYIRKFTPRKPEKPEPKEPARDDFEERFRQLQKELQELQEAYRRISDEAADDKRASPTNMPAAEPVNRRP